MDNLLTYKLAKEIVTLTKHEALLLKENFIKAYNKVEHSKMLALGFHPHIIKLVSGLMENTKSKVHINGKFTKPIVLGRGVR